MQARALGVYLLVSQGGLAIGSAAWGFVAAQVGVPVALLGAAAMLSAGTATAWRWPLPVSEDLDLRPARHWPAPELAFDPSETAGPVLITVEYRIAPADPERMLEAFVVASWAEHIRQHDRFTVADRVVEEAMLALQKPGTVPLISHFIAAEASVEASCGIGEAS